MCRLHVIAGIDLNAFACKLRHMNNSITSDLDQFLMETGLSEHRAGILLARNGRLIDRLRSGGRIWPETEDKIRAAMARERAKRKLPNGVGAK